MEVLDNMIGAIIGDIAGSRFEFHNYRKKNFEIFSPLCFFTDDTVMTLSVAAAIMACKGNYNKLTIEAADKMHEIGRKYPNCGYGGMFRAWMFGEDPQPYGSFGNGAAMRVSPCGFMGKTMEEVKEMSYRVTSVTHNHREGIKGAEATAVSIFLARNGKDKDYIRDYINKNYYKLDFTIDGIRDSYKFNETCQQTVPQALECFLESESFEDCVRISVSLGGDCDTVAAISCGIAEAYFGVPDDMRRLAELYLDNDLLYILQKAEGYVG